MDWTFGTFLWAMVALFFWFAVIWMFLAVFTDIFRRDMSGWAKAGWVALIVIVPFLGALIYMIAMPPAEGGYGWGQSSRAPRPGAADEIAKAAQLYDQGRITADEYEYIKGKALAR